MDCLEGMKQMQTESVDLICTDAPYGLSFMGREWDKATPSVDIWRECNRILKTGAFAFIMSSPRADVMCQMITRLQEAGFRTDFTPIYWAYASGFPKAANIGKMVDKKLGATREIVAKGKYFDRQPNGLASCNVTGFSSEIGERHGENGFITTAASPEAKLLDGSYAGFQVKPSIEVILVVMKPLSEATYVDQALKNGKGITWLDDCRIPFKSENDAEQAHNNTLGPVERSVKTKAVYDGGKQSGGFKDTFTDKGRFTANLLVSDNCLDNGEITKSGHMDSIAKADPTNQNCYGKMYERPVFNIGDEGQFSRYFSLDAWFAQQIKLLPPEVQKVFPFLIVPKADNGERNDGLEHLPLQEMQTHGVVNPDNSGTNHNTTGQKPAQKQNIHPTVKPLMLMSYLVTLGSRPNDVVVDPFVGSGTTAIACKVLNRQYVAFEKEKTYFDIAIERTNFSVNQPLVESIVNQSSKYLTEDNIKQTIRHTTKINKKFGDYFK